MPHTDAALARELAKNSSDCSFLLTHLIRQNENKSDADAQEILVSILDLKSASPNPMLKSSAVGWYGTSSPHIFDPATMDFDYSSNNKAVCFTESTLVGLKAHRDLFQVKYGLAFDRDELFSYGANPCINISNNLLRKSTPVLNKRYDKYLYNFIPRDLHPLVNVIHGSFDATHEREWRFPSDLGFRWSSIRFLFCPEEEFHQFVSIQNNAIPCLFDLAWLDRI